MSWTFTFLTAAVLTVACSTAIADDDVTLFQANGCPACHHPELNQTEDGLGPSLAQIASAYRGEPMALIEFLRGDGDPRLYPDKYLLMKTQLPRVMSLSKTRLRSLADYMLGH